MIAHLYETLQRLTHHYCRGKTELRCLHKFSRAAQEPAPGTANYSSRLWTHPPQPYEYDSTRTFTPEFPSSVKNTKTHKHTTHPSTRDKTSGKHTSTSTTCDTLVTPKVTCYFYYGGPIVIRTHHVHQNPNMPLFLLPILGPQYYSVPRNIMFIECRCGG